MSDAAPPLTEINAPTPRETRHLFGQAAAERAFLDAFASGKMHHAWLIMGPEGIGKATLAWRIARFLLATPPVSETDMFGAPVAPETLEIDWEHPVARRVQAGAEPRLKPVSPTQDAKGKLRDRIVIDDIRALAGFFQLSAADGGRRVVIIDAADDLNANAANALLKMLEEPPADAVILLVAHQPARLLPTIRSRCRTLRLAPLGPDDMARALEHLGLEAGRATGALAELASGSVGRAVRLMSHDGVALYTDIVRLLATLPRLDGRRALALSERAAARGADSQKDLLFDLLDIALARLARSGASGQPPAVEITEGEAACFAQLAPDARSARAWADIAVQTSARTRHGRAVNLDPGALVLDTLFKLQETAAA